MTQFLYLNFVNPDSRSGSAVQQHSQIDSRTD